MDELAARAQEYKRNYELLKTERALWDPHWQEIAELCLPNSADFTIRRAQGEKRTERIFDSTQMRAVERFAAYFESYNTPRNQRWQRIKARDNDLNDDPEVKIFFEAVTEELFNAREEPVANFYNQLSEVYKSLGVFGNGCLYIEEVPEGILYRQCAISRTYIALDQHRSVDTVYYSYDLTAKAAEQRWGREKLPNKINAALEQNPFESFEFLHIVQPRKSDAGKPWESVDLCVDGPCIVDEGGFDEMPYVYSRFSLYPGETYGRSPAMLVLPDIKTLQEMMKTHLRAGQKIADPPLLLSDDGILGGGARRVRLSPGGLNWGGLGSAGQRLIEPLVTGARLDITETMIAEIRQTIWAAYGLDLFDIADRNRPEQTATEVMDRRMQRFTLLGPVVGRNQAECIVPMTHREFAILRRQRRVPPLPQALIQSGKLDYVVVAQNEATRDQAASEVGAIVGAIGALAPLVNADPSVLENLKIDETAQRVLERSGVPAILIRPPEEVKQLRLAQAQQSEQAELADRVPQAATALRDLAEASTTLRQPRAA